MKFTKLDFSASIPKKKTIILRYYKKSQKEKINLVVLSTQIFKEEN